MQLTHKSNLKSGVGAGKDLYEMCMSLYQKSILFGWKREFYKAAFLTNLKTFRLHDHEDKTFQEYVDDLHISETSAKRYVRIGKRLAELAISDLSRPDNEPIFLTEEILEAMLIDVVHADKITVRGLDKATRDLSTFTGYLNGEIDESALNLSNPKVKSLTSGETEAASVSVNAHGHLVSTDHEEDANTVLPSHKRNQEPGIEVWSRIEKLVATIPVDLWEIIKAYGTEYTKMQDKNGELHKKVGAKFKTIVTILQQSQRMISALHLRDLKEVEAILKH